MSLKEVQENTITYMKELNKTSQDIKMEKEALKKIQREMTLEMEKPSKEIRSHKCKHQQQNTKERREKS